jgi:hypothetical protein
MVQHTLFFILVSAFALPSAMAQQLFKVVGPDGKVTFSDKPPLQKAGKVSVMHSYTLRPYITQQSPAELAAAVAAKRAAAAEAALAGPANPLVAPVLTQEVEDAIVTVMGQVEFSRRFYNYCNTSLSGAKAFSQAARAWKERNAAPIGHQNRLLMEVVSPTKRDELQGKVAKLLEEESAKVAARNARDRQAWCAGAVAELNSGKADIVQPAMMAVPIVPYRAK